MAQGVLDENYAVAMLGISTLSDTTLINIAVNPSTNAVIVEVA